MVDIFAVSERVEGKEEEKENEEQEREKRKIIQIINTYFSE
jgi:hypothetical protein